MEEKKSKTEKSTKNQKTEIVAADKVERASKTDREIKRTCGNRKEKEKYARISGNQ